MRSRETKQRLERLFDEDQRDLVALLEALAELIRNAKPVRFRNQVWISRAEVYDLLDLLRARQPFALKELRLYRVERQAAGEPLLGDSQPTDDTLPRIDALDDLLHNASHAPLDLTAVRVDRAQLSLLADRLSSSLLPAAKELAAYRAIGPLQADGS